MGGLNRLKAGAKYVAQRRLRAREAGLCITCCQVRPESGRAVCAACSAAAAKRTARRRTEKQYSTRAQTATAALERAGDEAYAHHLYQDAAQRYGDASKLDDLGSVGRLRIAEKLARALTLSGNPGAANPLLDGALKERSDDCANAAQTVEILLQQARQLFLGARTKEALPLIRLAIQTAESSNVPRLCKLANGRMANYLLGLARYEEAERYISAIGDIRPSDDPSVRATYYTQKAIIASAFGRAIEAFEQFERAVDVAKHDTDLFQLVKIWDVYATWAIALGNIELAKSCFERALFVARQYQVTVLIPVVNLNYVGVLSKLGLYGLARDHLLNALSYDVQAPVIDAYVVEFGIPLALHLSDEETLARCARLPAIDFAFRSGQPSLIGPVAAAFAQWHVAGGRPREARALLSRAARRLKRISQSWDFPIAVARYGADRDVPEARELLSELALLPSSKVAQSCLTLFDALVAQRNGHFSEARELASKSAERFETLGWRGDAEFARTLLPLTHSTASEAKIREPLADMLPALTTRERQVAELVLAGLTNREVSTQLLIAKSTVDSHVGSILGRLGIRSRHQLTTAILKTD